MKPFDWLARDGHRLLRMGTLQFLLGPLLPRPAGEWPVAEGGAESALVAVGGSVEVEQGAHKRRRTVPSKW